MLGPRRVKPSFLSRQDAVGVANGLAWTKPWGGEILPIEVQIVRGGSGKLELTGSLGEVMKDSANLPSPMRKRTRKNMGTAPNCLKTQTFTSTRQRGPSRRTGQCGRHADNGVNFLPVRPEGAL